MTRKTLLATLAGFTLLIGLAATSPWDELRDSFKALSERVEGVATEQAELEQNQQALSKQVEGLSGSVTGIEGRLTALEKKPPPPPPPPPDPELLQAEDLEYIGSFLLPRSGSVPAKFDYSAMIACPGPQGLFVSGHEHGNWVAEVTIPDNPSKTAPPRAEFIQPFANLIAGREGIDQPRLGGLAYEKLLDRLYVNFYRHYNVAHNNYPSLCWGPGDLSKHVAEGTPLFRTTDPDGALVDHELTVGNLAMTPFGLTLVNQKGKHASKSFGPALATVTIGDDGPTNFRQHLFYERGSTVFPDPPNGWNETCSANGFAAIGRTGIFAGKVGLGTGLPEYYATRKLELKQQLDAGTLTQAEYDKEIRMIDRAGNVWYGGPEAYPIPGIAVCKGPASKGYHAPPYKTRFTFYDLDEIANAEDPSLPMPYAILDLSTDEFCGATECGFDPGSLVWLSEREWLLVTQGGGTSPRVHVVKVKNRRQGSLPGP